MTTEDGLVSEKPPRIRFDCPCGDTTIKALPAVVSDIRLTLFRYREEHGQHDFTVSFEDWDGQDWIPKTVTLA